jgi:hypothetical protein
MRWAYPAHVGFNAPSPGALRRLVEELGESGLLLDGSAPWHSLAVSELAYALRPPVHERRVPSYGAILDPIGPTVQWQDDTGLSISRRTVGETPTAMARRYADGLASWLIRRHEGFDEWAVFDRPAGSERDLVILTEATRAVLVQRHPTGTVRIVGDFGVYRWAGLGWRHEPLISSWIDSVTACPEHGDRSVLETMLEFAVHDLGARGIGAIIVYRPDDGEAPTFEQRLPAPPSLDVRDPSDLAPLRHVLAQIDGATIFDAAGTLQQLGVRLVPSAEAEDVVAGYRGTRHTAGRRYSFDDPRATVIVVSEDGPVTVLRNGEVLGASAAAPVSDSDR